MIVNLNSAKLSGRKIKVKEQLIETQLTLNVINLMGHKIRAKKPDIEEPYLEVIVPGDYLWLMPSNNYTDDVDILSNVIWTVN